MKNYKIKQLAIINLGLIIVNQQATMLVIIVIINGGVKTMIESYNNKLDHEGLW